MKETSASEAAAARLPADAVEAWQESFLGDLPGHLAERLLENASLYSAPSGEILLRGQAPNEAAAFLILSGLVRVYLTSKEGRQATTRYAGRSEIVGLPPILTGDIPVTIEAVTESDVVRMSARDFRALASREVAVAWATACYLARQLRTGNETLGANIFFPVRARVARHLLDLAERTPAGLVVGVQHQYIADAIGSVREVVSREMKRLADEGVISRAGGGIVIHKPADLHVIASGERPRGS